MILPQRAPNDTLRTLFGCSPKLYTLRDFWWPIDTPTGAFFHPDGRCKTHVWTGTQIIDIVLISNLESKKRDYFTSWLNVKRWLERLIAQRHLFHFWLNKPKNAFQIPNVPWQMCSSQLRKLLPARAPTTICFIIYSNSMTDPFLELKKKTNWVGKWNHPAQLHLVMSTCTLYLSVCRNTHPSQLHQPIQATALDTNWDSLPETHGMTWTKAMVALSSATTPILKRNMPNTGQSRQPNPSLMNRSHHAHLRTMINQCKPETAVTPCPKPLWRCTCCTLSS